MALDDEISRITNSCDLIGGQADVDINDAMALRTREVVVMLAAIAHTVVVRAVGELNAREQFHIYQLFDRAVDRGPAYARLGQS